jgi:hypothetical protein
MKFFLTSLISVFLFCGTVSSKDSNSQQARQLFDQTYDMVFGDQGCTLHYDVNIIGIYKTAGTIWYKGKKSKFVESRHSSWNNGMYDFRVDHKKKTVSLFHANSTKKDKYAGKFTFNRDDYNYSMEDSNEGLVINLDARRSVKGIKHAKAIIDKKTHAPKSLKLKVLWFWTTVRISQFKSGGISDDEFKFPASQFKTFQFYDKRDEN